MTAKKQVSKTDIQESLPSTELVQQELAKAKSMDDFFGKEGIFARLFSNTLEQMLEAELGEHLGYERYEAKGRNSGNNRNGHYAKKIRTSQGETLIRCPGIGMASLSPRLSKSGKPTPMSWKTRSSGCTPRDFR